MTKKEAQQKLDRLRKDKRAYQKGTEQYQYRIRLETILDEHMYDKEHYDRL